MTSMHPELEFTSHCFTARNGHGLANRANGRNYTHHLTKLRLKRPGFIMLS